jgi:hypothetical protein
LATAIHSRRLTHCFLNGKVLWEKPFPVRRGEHVAHTFANLKHHRLQVLGLPPTGRRHVPGFGPATLSFANGTRTEDGDTFVIEARILAPLHQPARDRAAGAGGGEGALIWVKAA